MKFLILGLLVSTAAMACPDINGEFECRSGSQVSHKLITTTDRGYLINTDGSETEFYVDGTVQSFPNTDSVKDVQIKGSCEGEKFIIDMTATIMDGTTVVWSSPKKLDTFFKRRV
ncbi:MAG: hypothetical protein AB7I27_14590 [Bacteriovoracaceae bacterium]